MLKEKAFTLSEVIITLLIIGVIAALTIPPLISHYRKSVATARIKRFYSLMTQAIILSEGDNGDLDSWSFSDFTVTDENGRLNDNIRGNSAYIFFNTYLAKYLKTYAIKHDASNFYDIYFHDGSKTELRMGECLDLIWDVNGDERPNEYALDKFRFVICPYGSRLKLSKEEKLSTYTATYTPIVSRSSALELCKSNRQLCARLLQLDNWEFKKDYPWK